MSHTHPYAGDEIREKKPTVLKGLVFLLLLIVFGAACSTPPRACAVPRAESGS